MNDKCTEQWVIAKINLTYDLSLLGVNNKCFKKLTGSGGEKLDKKIRLDDLDQTISDSADKTDLLKATTRLSRNGHLIVDLYVEVTYILTDQAGLFSFEDIAQYRDPLEFINYAMPQIDPDFAELAHDISCKEVSWFI